MHSRGGGGVLKLFFDEVCNPRSETPTHIQVFFSLKKQLNSQFFRNFSKSRPISRVFLPQKRLILQFFSRILWNGTLGGTLLKAFFWTIMGPMSKDFWWKSNPFGQHIPVCLIMWVTPPDSPSRCSKHCADSQIIVWCKRAMRYATDSIICDFTLEKAASFDAKLTQPIAVARLDWRCYQFNQSTSTVCYVLVLLRFCTGNTVDNILKWVILMLCMYLKHSPEV